jgi:hypothetical protein
MIHRIIYTYIDVRANGRLDRPKKIMPPLVASGRPQED